MARPDYNHRLQPRERDHLYWQQIIENRLPLVGPWFREVAATRLAQAALGGSIESTRSLAKAIANNSDERVKEIARDALLNLERPSTWNAAWSVWVETRSTELEALLLERNQTATAPPLARALSHIKLKKSSLLNRANNELVVALLQAAEDADPQVADEARQVLSRLTYSDGILTMCATWSQERKLWQEEVIHSAPYVPADPFLRVLVWLKRDEPERVLEGGAEIVLPLAQACQDSDPAIAEMAEFCLHHLSRAEAIDELCAIWSANRQPVLERLIVHNGWLAEKPFAIRLLTALKTGRTEIARQVTSTYLDALLTALEDSDEEIRVQASSALLNLAVPESIDTLCQRYLDQGSSKLRDLILQAGYLPSTTEQRALFLFLTEQWEAYAALDFDQRILRAIFASARPELRKRISHTLQVSGRSDFVNILAGVELRTGPSQLSPDDTQIIVSMLTQSQDWSRLWQIAKDLSLAWIIRIIRQLGEAGWQPDADDAPLFQQLVQASQKPLALKPEDIRQVLPVAIPEATLRVSGRVNSIAFSPTGPLLAVGTGQRKVLIWNYQRGAVEQILGRFDHSIGRVAYGSKGNLFFAERANPDSQCSLYQFHHGETTRTGTHDLSINALVPVGDFQVASAGNDRKVRLWDANVSQLISEATLPGWASRPRELVWAESDHSLAVLHDNIGFLTVPGLDGYREYYRSFNKSARIEKSVPRCAAFLPGHGDMAVGQHNGQVIWYGGQPEKSYRDKYLLIEHKKSIHGICYLPGRSILLSGGSEGEVKLIPWPARQPVETLPVPGGSLSSLQTSPDENLLATGCGTHQLVLWDLRVMDLPAILARPLSQSHPEDLPLLNSLSGSTQLPAPVQNSVSCLRVLLQHRYRFDIELADQPAIQPGEFDILLDEPASKT